jgi:hypothetical protein
MVVDEVCSIFWSYADDLLLLKDTIVAGVDWLNGGRRL